MLVESFDYYVQTARLALESVAFKMGILELCPSCGTHLSVDWPMAGAYLCGVAFLGVMGALFLLQRSRDKANLSINKGSRKEVVVDAEETTRRKYERERSISYLRMACEDIAFEPKTLVQSKYTGAIFYVHRVRPDGSLLVKDVVTSTYSTIALPYQQMRVVGRYSQTDNYAVVALEIDWGRVLLPVGCLEAKVEGFQEVVLSAAKLRDEAIALVERANDESLMHAEDVYQENMGVAEEVYNKAEEDAQAMYSITETVATQAHNAAMEVLEVFREEGVKRANETFEKTVTEAFMRMAKGGE